MSVVRRVAHGVWAFVVGDDWTAAVAVGAAIGVTAVLASADVAAWWAMPTIVLVTLAVSLRRAIR